MLQPLFAGAPIATLVLAVVCYAAMVLYAARIATRGAVGDVDDFPALLLLLVYGGSFPLACSRTVWLIQCAATTIGLAYLAPVSLEFHLARHREMRSLAADQPCREPLLSLLDRVLVYGPATLALAVVALWLWPSLSDESIEPATAFFSPAARGPLGIVLLVWSLEFGLAAVLGRRWLRQIGHIPLLLPESRYVWINGAAAILGMVELLAVATGSAPVLRYTLLGMLVAGLGAGFNELSLTYDEALRRILSFHLLLGITAAIVIGGGALLVQLGFDTVARHGVLLLALTLVAIAMPARIDRLLARRLLPRAAALREHLTEIGAAPLDATTRAEAAGQLLARLTRTLDSEGGVLVLRATEVEPAALATVGSIDAAPLGDRPDGILQAFTGLGPNVRPVRLGGYGLRLLSEAFRRDGLAFADQLRLLRCGVVLVCPLVRDRLEGVLLLGPRRGWLYDAAAVTGLQVFASQAALALQNLTLVTARVTAERQLAHREKLAALGEAAARIAHEIRNPLAAARSLVQLSTSDADPALTEPALGELDRIGRLVGDLLSFARRDELRLREVALAAVCRQALAQIEPLARASDVEIELDLDATLNADIDRLVQVVANLCRNAVEALDGAPPPRRLRVAARISGDDAVIEVRDNGPGIETAELARLFEPFATSKSSGTGLGLSTARQIVRAHGGTVSVESTPGSETVFRVTLPGARAAARNVKQERTAGSS